MDTVTKSVEAAVEPVESDHDAGEFEVILSTGALDRDGERLHADEWKQPLPSRIHFDSDHGMSIEKTVGSGVPRIEDGVLKVRGTYAKTPHAQMVRTLVNDGHITSTSVTFQNIKTSKDAGPQRELLNGAFVAVPANPEAVVLSSKATKDDKKPKPYGDVTYADPANGKYPIDTAEHVRAAWSYINRRKDADKYSADELSKIKDRIKRAADKFGIDISDDAKSLAGALADVLMKQFGASGNNPQMTHDGMVQAIHDAAYHLGAECVNAADADPGTADGGNKTFETSSTKSVGLPQESTTPAEAATKAAVITPAEVSAKAADGDAADRERLALRARSLQFLMSKTCKETT